MSFLNLGVPWWELVVRSVIIYAFFMLGLRVFGKREIGQFTLFDLVLILLVANAQQPAITGPDTSLTGGLIIIATLLVINRGLALIRTRVPAVDRLIEPQPTVVARDGTWLSQSLEKEGLSQADVEMALREHGLDNVEDVRLAVLEEDGTISVVPKDLTRFRRRPRVRFRRQN